MKKIFIIYSHDKIKELKFERGQEFDYSIKKLNSIVCYIISRGYPVMLLPNKEHITVVIDGKGERFRQKG